MMLMGMMMRCMVFSFDAVIIAVFVIRRRLAWKANALLMKNQGESIEKNESGLEYD